MNHGVHDYLATARNLRARRLGQPVPPKPHPPTGSGEVTVSDPASSSGGAFNPTRKHALIASGSQLRELATALGDASRVALDTETYPQDETNAALDPRRGRVRLISVAARGGTSGVIDVTRVDPTPLLDAIRGKTLIAHNGKFDLSFLKNQFGYEHDGQVWDTQGLDSLLYYAEGPRQRKDGWLGMPAGKPRMRSLRDLAVAYLDTELSKEEQGSDFGRADLTEAQVRYALRDAEVLIPLQKELSRRIRQLGLNRVAELEARFLPTLAYCENNGFAFDVEGWKERLVREQEEMAKCVRACDSLAPPSPEEAKRVSWNWNSPAQVAQALILLGAELPKKDSGAYATGDAALKSITSPAAAAELAQSLLRHRALSKKISTWGWGWLEPPKRKAKGGDHQIVVAGRVFSSFRQGVATGRMSSSKPNLQNVPGDLRRYFVAPPGRKLLIADYKHIELLPLAAIAGEEKLIGAFREGVDVHNITARGLLESDPNRDAVPVTEDEVEEFRPKAKTVAFGIVYGISARVLAKQLAEQFGWEESEEQAQSLIDRFMETYPRVAAWYERERRKAIRGEDKTRTLTGRLRLLDKVLSRKGKWYVRPQLRLNTPIQGSAGDGFKYALALTWERRRECLGSPMIVNLVHDEVIVEIDGEHTGAGKKWLEGCMLDGMAEVLGPDVPAAVEITISDRWDTG